MGAHIGQAIAEGMYHASSKDESYRKEFNRSTAKSTTVTLLWPAFSPGSGITA